MNKDINLITPINALGYGVVGYNIFKSLVNSGFRVSLFPIGQPSWLGDNEFNSILEKCVDNATFYDKNAPSLRIWHQFELDMFPGKGSRIGWPIFELNKFNKRELHHLNNVDRIIVCTNWAKQILLSNDVKPAIHVVPLGVDGSIFFVDESDKAQQPVWSRSSTIFLNVGKWEKRKGHEELLEAFNKAFVEHDNVELWMLNDNPFIGHENDLWRKKYAASKMGAHIKFMPRIDSHSQLKKIFNWADCGVFPSKAEGWNLEIPEMMACGNHIIATNYSGHTEFLTKENSLMIDVAGMESANDGKWFHGQGEWATFNIGQLVDHMLEIHELKQNGELGINDAGVETVKKLTWKNSVERLIEAI